MRRRNIVILTATVLLLSVLLLVGHYKTSSSGPKLGPTVNGCSKTVPNKEIVTAAIKKQAAATGKSGSYTVTNLTEPQLCWDVVTLTQSGAVEPQTAVLQRVGNAIYLSAGPGTSFPKSLMEQLNVPASVQSALVIYDDTSTPAPSET